MLLTPFLKHLIQPKVIYRRSVIKVALQEPKGDVFPYKRNLLFLTVSFAKAVCLLYRKLQHDLSERVDGVKDSHTRIIKNLGQKALSETIR
jgi:hypothetical protein